MMDYSATFSGKQDEVTSDNQSKTYSNGAVTIINIPISGVRPIQLGSTLKSPTNMSVKLALSLTDEEYERIRDSIDNAIQNEAVLQELDLDAKNSTDQERQQFHELISRYLSSDLSDNEHLVDKLTVQYKDVSPWLMYKFTLLRRKKYRNSIKAHGSKEDIANTSHSTIDIGNPKCNNETTSPGSTSSLKSSPPIPYQRKLTTSYVERILSEDYFSAEYDGSDELSDFQKSTKKIKREDHVATHNILWVYIPAVCFAFASVLAGLWLCKLKLN